MDVRRRMLFKKKASSGEELINTDNYLTIEALENGLTAKLSVNACEYCVDGDGNWKILVAGTATQSINSGHTLSFRGELTPNSSNGIGTFTISKKCNLKGNCMSMLFGDNAADNYSLSGYNSAFRMLFNSAPIVEVSKNFLPATQLTSDCYRGTFYTCTYLKNVPDLPATTLADSCYRGMFYKCTSLTTIADLPAITLASYCYNAMFSGCTNLKTIPLLPVTKLAKYCYASMFQNCTSLTTAPELPATTLESNCYESMFYGCSNLTTAPTLPATTLVSGCYFTMFYLCEKLNYIKMLATDASATNCLRQWVEAVASSGTFVKNSNMNSLPTGISGIPSGWTVQNATS